MWAIHGAAFWGLTFTARHPELVKTYIGCGQVVNMKKSCRTACEYALAHADSKSLERLRTIDCTYTGDNWLSDLLFVTKQVVKHKGSLYGKTNYNKLITPFLFPGATPFPICSAGRKAACRQSGICGRN